MVISSDVLPRDQHNATLTRYLHPQDWVNPEPADRYNLVVIGAGPAGLIVAAGAAGLGAKVALIEKHLMGGDCLNVGCVPSKALIRAARAYADVRDAGNFGVIVPPGTQVDFPAVMERMRRLRAGLSSHDSVERYRSLGVDMFLGQGKFKGPDTIEVAGKDLRFSKAVIATGARAAVPPIPGLAESEFLTNETIFSLTELPARLAVIGAGPIGCEMAQAFRRFGSDVFLLQQSPQILTREDPDAAAVVQEQFRRDGVNLVLNSKIQRIEGNTVVLADRTLEVDKILLGVGRAPNVQGLDLEAAGVEYDERTGVKVNDRLQTSQPNIYAAGDISSRYQFTHAADAAARIVIQNALFRGRKKASALTIPWCTYTDPEIAHVGMYEKDAQERGIPVRTFRVDLKEMDRAVLDGETDGFLKIHVRDGKDRILGATLVARHAGEMISEVTVAMVGGLGLGAFSATIHPYPTQAECFRRAGDAYNRTRLTPLVLSLMRKWLAWSR